MKETHNLKLIYINPLMGDIDNPEVLQSKINLIKREK